MTQLALAVSLVFAENIFWLAAEMDKETAWLLPSSLFSTPAWASNSAE